MVSCLRKGDGFSWNCSLLRKNWSTIEQKTARIQRSFSAGRRGSSTPEAPGKTFFFSLSAAGGSETLSPSDLRTVDEVHPEKVGYDGKTRAVFPTFPGA
jgi:hypothetical protein